jgi:hypothetical protein
MTSASGRWRTDIDYHISFDGNFYGVPYAVAGELVDVRATPATVEIFHRGKTRGVASAQPWAPPERHGERPPADSWHGRDSPCVSKDNVIES